MLFLLASLCESRQIVGVHRLDSFLELHRVRSQDLRRFRLLESSDDFPVLGWALSVGLLRCSIVAALCFVDALLLHLLCLYHQ